MVGQHQLFISENDMSDWMVWAKLNILNYTFLSIFYEIFEFFWLGSVKCWSPIIWITCSKLPISSTTTHPDLVILWNNRSMSTSTSYILDFKFNLQFLWLWLIICIAMAKLALETTAPSVCITFVVNECGVFFAAWEIFHFFEN